MARSLDVYLLGQFVGRFIQDIHGDMGSQYAENIKSRLPEVTPDHPVGIGVAELIRSRCNRTIERFGKWRSPLKE